MKPTDDTTRTFECPACHVAQELEVVQPRAVGEAAATICPRCGSNIMLEGATGPDGAFVLKARMSGPPSPERPKKPSPFSDNDD